MVHMTTYHSVIIKDDPVGQWSSLFRDFTREPQWRCYTYTPEGRRIGVTTYQEVHRADGIAMDTAGNLLIADHDMGEAKVYSPCGALIKTI